MSMDLKNKKITVMGLGVHGGAIGNIKWLHDQGAKLVVTDLKSGEALQENIAEVEKLEGVELVLGRHREHDFTEADMVIRNPAVPKDSRFLGLARDAGVPVEMDSSLFFKVCPSKNIIGITGTKGKTTTTHAIGEVLKEKKAVVVGVEGTTPLGSMPDIDEDTIVVFELSSWRLEAMNEYQISPSIAVVTSIYKDHLNTYDSFDDYIETKKGITKWQVPSGKVLLNADDEVLRTWKDATKAEVWWYSVEEPFGDRGIALVDGNVVIYEGEKQQKIMPVVGLPFTSEHERRNVLPAIWMANEFGMRGPEIVSSVGSIKGLPHRLEQVGVIDGALYINDSSATMPDATIAALKSFEGKDIILILGGNDKELEFEDLGKAVGAAGVKKLIWLPGTITEVMQEEVWKNKGLKEISVDVNDMEEAVQEANAAAASGDVVLLSPGATSFYLFQHEFERGDDYKTEVGRLKRTK